MPILKKYFLSDVRLTGDCVLYKQQSVVIFIKFSGYHKAVDEHGVPGV